MQSTQGINPSSSWIVKYGFGIGRRYPHATAVIHLLAGVWLVGLGAGLVVWSSPWGWALLAVAALHFWLGYLWERSTRR
jgi:hypothetical protein